MRFLPVAATVAVFILDWSFGNADSKSTAEPPGISRSGSDFLEVCSSIESEENSNPVRTHNNAICLGWVEGFVDGFTVHEELLGVPQKDRLVCVPRKVSPMQTVRVIKKYITDNPAKAHRPTRYVASLALAGAFPCKAGN